MYPFICVLNLADITNKRVVDLI